MSTMNSTNSPVVSLSFLKPWLVVAVALLFVACSAANKPAPTSTDRCAPEQRNSVALMAELMATISREGHGQVYSLPQPNESTAAYLRRVDPHASYHRCDSKLMSNARSGRKLAAVGVEFARQGDHVIIIGVMPNSPASAADLALPARLLELDGQPLPDELSEIRERLQGASGSVVKLTVQSGEEPQRESSLTRQVLLTELDFSLATLPGGYLHIRLHNVYAKTAAKLKRALQEELQAQAPVRGFILDLRNNSGGNLLATIDIAGLFSEANSFKLNVEKKGQVIKAHEPKPEYQASFTQQPMVVLINKASLAGAEMIAQQLQHSERALLVGEPTIGMAVLRSAFFLSNRDWIVLSVANWRIDGAATIADQGLQPDLVRASADGFYFSHFSLDLAADRQFQAAFDLLKGMH